MSTYSSAWPSSGAGRRAGSEAIDMFWTELATRDSLRELERRLTIRLGSMLIVAVEILLAAMRYLPPHP